jgi:hypothetical protein
MLKISLNTIIIIRNSSILEKYTMSPDNAILSDAVTSYTFRNGRGVIVKEGSGSAVSNGTWSISDLDTNDFISFSIDLADTKLLNGDTIALHWGMTCGNDTIEGAYSVPEPTILGLLASDPSQ